MATFPEIQTDLDYIRDKVYGLADYQNQKDAIPMDQPYVDTLAAHVKDLKQNVDALVANEKARVTAIENWGGAQQDVNPSGPGGLAATLGQTETNPTPNFENGPAQAVAEALAADQAATVTQDVHDAVVAQQEAAPEAAAASTEVDDVQPSQEDADLGAARTVPVDADGNELVHDPSMDISDQPNPHPEATNTPPGDTVAGVPLPEGTDPAEVNLADAGGVPPVDPAAPTE